MYLREIEHSNYLHIQLGIYSITDMQEWKKGTDLPMFTITFGTELWIRIIAFSTYAAYASAVVSLAKSAVHALHMSLPVVFVKRLVYVLHRQKK